MRGALLAFAAGAGVMGLEMLASRWLAPAFGFTLSTWSILISVTLLAGSAGAWLGGAVSRRSWATPGGALLVGAVGIATDGLVAPGLTDDLIDLPIVVGALVASLALLVVPVAALAAVVPVLAQRGGGATGAVVGRLVGASTLGSLAGTLVTAHGLVPLLGLRTSALALAGILALGGALSLRLRLPGAVAVLAIVVAAFARPISRAPGEHDTPYGRLVVERTDSGIHLRVNGIEQGTLPPFSIRPGSLLRRRQYVELLPWIRPGARTALCVGLGGALHQRGLEAHGIAVESIEIDPVLAAVVRDELGYAGPVRIGDGRAVLRRLDRRYDLVVLDAFRGESVPAHLLTREALVEVRERLSTRGVVCVHLIGRPGHPATAAVARTLGAVFENVLAVGGGVAEELTDLFLFASDGPLVVPPHPELTELGWLGNETFEPELEGAFLLTDDRPLLDRLNEPLARELRRRSRKSRHD